MRNPRAVIFDLDGTLVDSWHLHLRCLRAACAAVRAADPSAAAAGAAQRATDLGTLRCLVGAAAAPAALAAYSKALHAELLIRAVPIMPGASEVVRRLALAGIPAGVCTGRSREPATALLASGRLPLPLLAAREDTVLPKPAPDGLRHALAQLGVPAGDALFVGDSQHDLRQGERAAVRTVLVTPGSLLTAIETAIRCLI